jgi:nucleoporin SEH1
VIEIDVQMMHPPPTPPMSGVDMFGAPGTSLGSSNGQSYGSSVGAARPGKREADGGWAVSWCKDKIWGQLLAVASGTTGIVKVVSVSL